MQRLIDANALKEHICNMCDDGQRECKGDESCALLCWVNDMPTIESGTVKHGRWIVHTTWHGMFGLINSECSECKFDRNGDLSSWKYCPNCGARMDAPHESDV